MFEIQDRLAQTFLVNNAMKQHHRMKWMFMFHFIIKQLYKSNIFPVNAGAQSVVMLANLCKGNPDLSKQFSTLSNKSWPAVVSFKCSSDINSSVISKFSSNPLINTSSCAVSFIPVLSSSASEYHSKIFHLQIAVLTDSVQFHQYGEL